MTELSPELVNLEEPTLDNILEAIRKLSAKQTEIETKRQLLKEQAQKMLEAL